MVNKQEKISWLASWGASDNIQEIEVQELVDLIHDAAADSNIKAIFGEFGRGRTFMGGAADLEEIRNALRVFQESHRVHNEPNLSYEPVLQRNSNNSPRLLYAYADSFESPDKPENPDYFLASQFTHIHLQKQGCLNLFGYSASIPFFREFLEKHNVKVHVYKHGPFKNAPNSFTESRFNKPHKENIETYLFALNDYMFEDIVTAREGLQYFEPETWKMIQNSVTFTAVSAKTMGFADYTPDRSPLDALLAFNQPDLKEKEKESLKAKWGGKTDLEHFAAEKELSLSEYRAVLSKRKRLKQIKETIQAFANLDRTKNGADIVSFRSNIQEVSSTLEEK